ncbi:MAG: RpiB/LacA/LacB family sugar-phosphate isomerase [Firmicutes bacterium]|nr:RpiB/LacA/LacB family sugar-phosphate isomerase [Bacillota bacterium]
MRIAVGSDERTLLTETVVAELQKRGHGVELFGPLAGGSEQWADVGLRVAREVGEGRCEQGILFCWTGTGVSIAANKVAGVRAALCADAYTARGARRWNHANVLVLSLRLTSEPVAREILEAWFETLWGESKEDLENVGRLHRVDQR